MRSSSSSFVLALLLVVTLTGVHASSRGGLVGVTSDAAPEDHERPHQLLMMERFHGWMAKHGRSYATAEEKLRRFEIYRSNVEFIEAANRDGRLTYKLRENHFTDLTHEEFLATHTMRAAPPETMTKDDEMVITTRAGDVEVGGCRPASSEVPHRVNWTDQGKVTRVKNQGTCGACWAFSAVAAIESAYAIAKGLEPPPELSEQELIDCDSLDHGCRSGQMSNAFKWVRWNGGIAGESSYPYKQTDGPTCDVAKRREHAATIQDFDFVEPANCEEKLMEAVAVRPVSVAFDPNDGGCFQHYWNGKYDGRCYVDGEYVGPCTSNNLSHALTIVGYVGKGDDEDKYWIAKNSWGDDWGDNGYVWLQKDVADPKGLCGLATHPVYPIA